MDFTQAILLYKSTGFAPYKLELVTARTNASEPKLERMLYYKDTKLRSRRRSRRGHVYIQEPSL